MPANDNDINLPSGNRQKSIATQLVRITNNVTVYNQTLTYTYDEDDSAWHTTISYSQGQFTTGSYAIRLKGPSHRRFLWSNITITANQTNNINLTNRTLEFGDVNSVDGVTVNDYSAEKACKVLNAQIGDNSYDNEGCIYADGNFDGVVDSMDMTMLLKVLSSGNTGDE